MNEVYVVNAVLVVEQLGGEERLHKVTDTVWTDETLAHARKTRIMENGLAGYEVANAHVRERPL